MTRATRTWVREVEYWGDRFPPACQCGCGDPVKFGQAGPTKYVNRAHANWDYRRLRRIAHGHKHGEVVDIQQFRAAVLKIKQTKGWTWNEIGVRSGWGPGRLNGVMFGGREQYLLKTTATEFFRRLAGLPGEMTRWERKQAEKVTRSGVRANLEISRYMTGQR